MLHQQHECLGENRTGKKMFFDVTVLHIDESVVSPTRTWHRLGHCLHKRSECIKPFSGIACNSRQIWFPIVRRRSAGPHLT